MELIYEKISSTGIHINDISVEISDERLKENRNEIYSKICYDIIKYIQSK